MRDCLSIRVLTYLGVIPFLFAFIVRFMPAEVYVAISSVQFIVTYGAIIVSFIAGTHWSYYLLDNKVKLKLQIHSNIIALIAWIAVLFHNLISIYVLIFCFLYLLMLDYKSYKMQYIQYWYFKLRLHVTALVCAILILYVFSIF